MRPTLIKTAIILPLFAIFVSACSLNIQQPQDAGIFYSKDSGQTWEQRTFVDKGKKADVTISSIDVHDFIFHPTEENIMYASTAAGIYKTTDKGVQWKITQLQNNLYSDFIIDPQAPSIQYAALAGKIVKTTTDDASWVQVYVERPGVAITSLALNPSATNIIWASTSAKGILKSEDFGNTWTLVAELKDVVKKIIIPKENPSIMYGILITSGFIKSTNSGTTWDEDITKSLDAFQGAKPIRSFHIREKTAGDIITTSNYGILRSTNGGESWQPLPTVVPFKTQPINDALISPANVNNIYFTAGNTFYKSVDGGGSWQTLKSLPTSQNIALIRINPNNYSDMFAGIIKITK